ncbi:MAG: porin family protein [Saprospiraceae bacterium]
MKNLVQAGLVISMIFLYASSFGQSKMSGSQPQKTYLDIFISAVGTDLNYGASNSSLTDFKKSAQGIQAGVSLQTEIASHLSLVPELSFIMRGGKLKVNNPYVQDAYTLRFYSIEIPVLVRLHLGKFHVNAGPALAYNFAGNQKLDGSTTKLSFDNAIGGFKRLDAGIQIGGGLTFKIKQKRAMLDIRYCYGLTNVSYDKEIYNRSLLIRLNISKK